jgi:uncharacterized protein YdhG (YjbR/CyaY superfamily)
MEVFKEYVSGINDHQHRERVEGVLRWVAESFPDLDMRIAWNQPMFTHHGTFIIGFSTAKKHLAVAPESKAIVRFSGEIVGAGYDHTKELIRIPWGSPVDFALLGSIIEYNIADKKDCKTFWRRAED